jgi:hypothetical protein
MKISRDTLHTYVFHTFYFSSDANYNGSKDISILVYLDSNGISELEKQDSGKTAPDTG